MPKSKQILVFFVLLSFNLAAIETIIYFWGLSHLNLFINKGLNYLNMVNITYNYDKVDIYLIFFSFFFVSLLSIRYSFKKYINQITITKNYINLIIETLAITTITNFIYRFGLGYEIHNLKSILVPTLLGLLVSIIYSIFTKFNFISKTSLLFVFIWLMFWGLIINLYLKTNAVYSFSVINDFGYIKDGILLCIILFLINIILPIIIQECNVTNKNIKFVLIIVLFGIFIFTSLTLFFELQFPKSDLGRQYALNLLNTQHIKVINSEKINSLRLIMNQHLIVRSVFLLLTGVVLPIFFLAFKKLFQCIKI